MSFLLNLIPAPYRVLAVVLIIVSLVGALLGWYEHAKHVVLEAGIAQGRAEVQADWDASVRKQQADAIAEAQNNAQETQRRLVAQKEAEDAHAQEVARAKADAARAHVAADSLRKQLDEFTAAARRAASDPAAVAASAPTGDAIGVLAELFSRADQRAGILAQALDASHAAGELCVREYDALSKKP